MTQLTPVPLLEHFAAVQDPRVDRTKLHPLANILTIAISAVICGAETWDDIATFGEAKAEWFAGFLDLTNGIPSHDTFNRVFAALDADQFRAGFRAWMHAVCTVLPAEVVALDGKTVRRSHDRGAGKAALHLVSAWAATNRLVLGQVQVADKSNEMTAIPDLLRALALRGCLVTLDAMGCQRDIAQQIRTQDADYVLALKDNQPALYADVQETFHCAAADAWRGVAYDYAREVDKGHGRIETRHAWVVRDAEHLAWLQAAHDWPGLAAVGLVEAERRIGPERTVERRYYLLSTPLSATAFGAAVRGHWGIENQVHWVLDVVFREDLSRMRAGAAAANMAVLRHIARNLLQQTTVGRLSIKTKRLKAGWDHAFLLQLLRAL
jgi:predicted transposase YbfD/YdcC